MTRSIVFKILVRVCGDEIVIVVDKNGKFFDEVVFHKSELIKVKGYFIELAKRIIQNITTNKD